MLFKHKDLPCVCPVLALEMFLNKSKDARSGHSNLFYSLIKDNQPAPIFEIRSWVSKIMGYAKVPNHFKPHSMRGATVSKAYGFLDTKTILAAADWSRQTTFKRYYLRNVGLIKADDRSKFQNAVFKK